MASLQLCHITQDKRIGKVLKTLHLVAFAHCIASLTYLTNSTAIAYSLSNGSCSC